MSEAAANLAAAVGMPALPTVDTSILPETLADLPLGDIQKAGLLHRADVRRSLLRIVPPTKPRCNWRSRNSGPIFQLNPGYNFGRRPPQDHTFGPGFDIPVFNLNRGPIAEAEARRVEAEARFNSLQAQAIGEMEIALAGI